MPKQNERKEREISAKIADIDCQLSLLVMARWRAIGLATVGHYWLLTFGKEQGGCVEVTIGSAPGGKSTKSRKTKK
jgi:hypothetical protein